MTEQDRTKRFGQVRAARQRGDVEYLIAALADPDNRFVAARYLADLRATEAIPDLMRLLDTAQPTTRAGAATALGRLQAVDAVPRLIELATSDPVPATRSYAIAALGRIRDPRTVVVAVRLLDDPEPWIRVSAVGALSAVGGPDADAAVTAVVRSERSWVWRWRYRRAQRRERRRIG